VFEKQITYGIHPSFHLGIDFCSGLCLDEQMLGIQVLQNKFLVLRFQVVEMLDVLFGGDIARYKVARDGRQVVTRLGGGVAAAATVGSTPVGAGSRELSFGLSLGRHLDSVFLSKEKPVCAILTICNVSWQREVEMGKAFPKQKE
jgi:hypothetical protein